MTSDLPRIDYPLLGGALSVPERLKFAQSSKESSVLASLASDPDSVVRLFVARNEWTPGSSLRRLSKDSAHTNDKNTKVVHPQAHEFQSAVLANPQCPRDLLFDAAARVIDGSDFTAALAVAGNANLPLETLREMSRVDHEALSVRIAQVARLPVADLEAMAVRLADKPAQLRWVLRSTRISPETLRRCAGHESQEILETVAWNRSTPPDAFVVSKASLAIVKILARVSPHEDVIRAVAARFKSRKSEGAYVSLFNFNPAAPADLLAEAAALVGTVWHDDEALANHPKATEAMLEVAVAAARERACWPGHLTAALDKLRAASPVALAA